MVTVARCADDLTENWFTALLAEHDAGPAGEVTVRPVAQGQISDVFRARVETPRRPWTLIVKLASSDPGSREVAARVGIYETEALFYRHLAAHVDVAVPRSYVVEFNPATHDFTLVLQDLSAVASPGNQARSGTIEQAVRAVRTIADLQVSTWNGGLEHRYPQLGRTSRNTDKFARVPKLRGAFLERFGSQLEPEHVALIGRVVDHAYRWATEWDGPRVLQHSDYRLDNLLFGHGPEDPPVTVIDWGGVKIGPPMVDVGYYLGGCLDPADRRGHERDILREYHGKLVAGGVSGWSLRDCERAYRRDAVYGLFQVVHAAPQVKRTVVGDMAFVRAVRGYADFVLELGSERVLPGMTTLVDPLGRTGVRINELDQLPWPQAAAAARELELIGYPTLWVNEVFGRDPLVTSALLLSSTRTTGVALGIGNVYSRDAVAMAASQYTLSEMFPRRFILGLGVGSPPVARARGHAFDRPLEYLTGYLAAMDAARYDAIRPAAPPRRLLAALGPKMLGLAARRADGAHTILSTPQHTAQARAILGPDAALVVEQVIVLDDDLERATTTAWRAAIKYRLAAPSFRAHLCRLGFGEDDWADPSIPSRRVIDALVACGNGDTVADRVAAHRAAGADHVVVQVLSSSGQVPLSQWRALAPFLL